MVTLLDKKLIPLRRTEPEHVSSVQAMRSEYFQTDNNEQLMIAYKNWVQIPLWLMFYNPLDKKYISVRGMKRGDKKHARIASSSFDRAQLLKPIVHTQQRTKSSPARTNTLWISLTYPGDVGSEAYQHVGKDFNRFLSAIRKRFGKIQYVRVWESQVRGTPHIHAIIIFQNKTWAWEYRRSKKNPKRKIPRIFGYKEVKKYWSHHSDVQAVDDYEQKLRYIKKYLTKQLEHKEDKDILACAHQMVYQNHTYFVPNLRNIATATKNPDLSYLLSNSNSESRKQISELQFLGTVHSFEPFHRTEIYQIDIDELTNKITAVHFLYWSEVPFDEIYQDTTVQTQLT